MESPSAPILFGFIAKGGLQFFSTSPPTLPSMQPPQPLFFFHEFSPAPFAISTSRPVASFQSEQPSRTIHQSQPHPPNDEAAHEGTNLQRKHLYRRRRPHRHHRPHPQASASETLFYVVGKVARRRDRQRPLHGSRAHRPRSPGRALDSDCPQLPCAGRSCRLLPLRRVPYRAAPRQQSHQPRDLRRNRGGHAQARPRPRDADRAGS